MTKPDLKLPREIFNRLTLDEIQELLEIFEKSFETITYSSLMPEQNKRDFFIENLDKVLVTADGNRQINTTYSASIKEPAQFTIIGENVTETEATQEKTTTSEIFNTQDDLPVLFETSVVLPGIGQYAIQFAGHSTDRDTSETTRGKPLKDFQDFSEMHQGLLRQKYAIEKYPSLEYISSNFVIYDNYMYFQAQPYSEIESLQIQFEIEEVFRQFSDEVPCNWTFIKSKSPIERLPETMLSKLDKIRDSGEFSGPACESTINVYFTRLFVEPEMSFILSELRSPETFINCLQNLVELTQIPCRTQKDLQEFKQHLSEVHQEDGQIRTHVEQLITIPESCLRQILELNDWKDQLKSYSRNSRNSVENTQKSISRI